jgi:hypothetical protein
MDGKPAEPATTARVLWDPEHLYVFFDAEDDDIWTPYTQRDDPLYNAEVVEAFIDADRSGSTYNELQVAPNGLVFDAYFPARRRGMDLSWDSGLTTRVRVTGEVASREGEGGDRGWTAEIAVPVARLAAVPRWPPQEGDAWKFNLYRLEVRSGQRGQALAPVRMPDFHHLPAFADLRFAETEPCP